MIYKMACYAFDLDGTLDVNPQTTATLMSDLVHGGNRVLIFTGASTPKPGRADTEKKVEYLKSIGIIQGVHYDQMFVIGDPPHATKAKLCKKEKVDMLFDNSIQNAKLCSKYSLVAVIWNSKVD